MHVLSLDVGTYSVKYISSLVERKSVSHLEMGEVIIKDHLHDHLGTTLEEAQLQIVREVLEAQARPETKIIYQAPNEMITTRFLTLPVKSTKKASLMLPFQLEEDIPYSLSEIHYAYRMEGQKTQHLALVELARGNVFEDYFNRLREEDIIPSILTTEASGLENYFNQNPEAGPFCVINFGHTTTRAYFFYNSRLLAINVSYIGGKDINEMIAQTYKIDADEAVFYKHQNAFVLTSDQYTDVDESQKEFAIAMDRTLAPLISDFSRWRVGFRVNFGLGLGQVYLTGGSANIKNIANYFSDKWDLKVSHLESFSTTDTTQVDANTKNKNKYSLANLFVQGFKKKTRFINFLIGRFAQAGGAELPLHSYGFIGVRVVMITVVFALSLLVERLFIQKDINFINGRLSNVLKNDVLEITPRQRRMIVTSPEAVDSTLTKRVRGIKQEISTLQSAIQIQALSPLVAISQAATTSKATLTEFHVSEAGDINATFTVETAEELRGLQNLLLNASLSDTNVQINEAEKSLTLSAKAEL